MLIEAAKGGHTNVVQLLLDYPHSMLYTTQQQAQGAAVVAAATATTNLAMLPGQVGGGPRNNCPAGAATMTPPISTSTGSFFQPTNGECLILFLYSLLYYYNYNNLFCSCIARSTRSSSHSTPTRHRHISRI